VHALSGFLRPHASWQKFVLASLSGLLGIIVFPRIGLSWMAWVCLVPLLIPSYREFRSGPSFVWGLTTGFIFFVGVCGWIAAVLRTYGDLSWLGASALFLLLAAYLSLFYGCFSLVFARVSLRFPVGSFYLCPFLWIATEYLRAHVLTGFPWCLLGYALVDDFNLAQLSTVTGVYGISFVVVLINGLAAQLLMARTKAALLQLGVTVVALVGISLGFSTKTARPILGKQEARIVQTNISSEQDWSKQASSALLDELAELSTRHGDNQGLTTDEGVRITLWPETPAPFYFNHDAEFRNRMLNLAESSRRYLLFGFVDFRSSAADAKRRDPYNSVALVSPEGNFISQYDKIHLVPFGEYIPYAKIFFFVDKISTEAGNFRSGERVVVSPLGSGHLLGTFVCYEAILPDLVRLFTAQGAQVLVNVTNDGWFGNSPAPYQHLNMARFRAIENHRYLLRAANSGISAVVDPYGRIQARSLLNGRMSLESAFEWETNVTFYARYGDVFAWSCIGISILALVGGVQFSGGSVKPQNKRLAKRTIDEVSTLNSLKVKKGE
jgi:apolipoprotein N-acyltransferase